MLRTRIHILGVNLLMIMFTITFVNAQNDVVKDINNKWSNINSWKVKAKAQIFKNENDTKPFNVILSQSSVSPHGSIIVNGDIEVLLNPKCSLIIDHKGKTIQYSSSSDKKNKDSYLNSKPKIILGSDTVINKYALKIEVLESGDVLYIANSLNNEDDLNSAHYYFRKGSYDLYKVEYYYSKSSIYKKVIIEYSLFEVNPTFDSNYFSEAKFLVGTGNKAKLQPKFNGYEFYNQYGKTLNDYLYEK